MSNGSDSELRELAESLEGSLVAIREKVDALVDEPDHGASDEQAADYANFLAEQSDVDVIVSALTTQRLVELRARGRARFTADLHAIAMFEALNRFAPETVQDAVAVYYEHAEEVDYPSADGREAP
jgi:hypothetical protein